MAIAAEALISNSTSIKNISESVSSMKRGINLASNATTNLKTTIIKRTKVKSELITRSNLLTARRREAAKRRELEDQIEASSLNPATTTGIKSIMDRSGRGLLGRILDFLGYLTIGWLLNNLPTWIVMGKEFIARLVKAGNIISGFVTNTFSLLKYFGNVVTSYAANIFSLDFEDSTGRVEKSLSQLYSTMDSMGLQLEEGYKLLSTPLTEGTESGQNAPATGTQAPNTLYPEAPITTVKPGSTPTGPGRQFNISQLVKLAQQVGFKGNNAAVAAAVAMAESGGNTKSHNTKYPDNSYGLWQINMLDVPGYLLGAERRKKYNLKSNDDLFDPVTNASIAYKISGGSNFGDWSTYNNGRHIPFLQEARKALSNPQALPEAKVSPQPTPSAPPASSANGQQGQTQRITGYSVERPDGRKVKGYGDLTPHHSYQSTSDGREVRDFTIFKGNQYNNAPVPSPIAGKITWTGYAGNGGNWVEIMSSSGKVELGHFNKIIVKAGQTVSPGTILGLQGATGRASGVHVHIQAASSVISNYISMLVGGSFSSPGAQGSGDISGQVSDASSGITPSSYPDQIMAVIPETPDLVLSGGGNMGGAMPSGAAPSSSSAVSPSVSESKMLNNFIKNKLLLDLAYL